VEAARRVVITLEGGLVQSVMADGLIDVYVVDYDISGAYEIEEISKVPQDDGTTQDALVYRLDVERDSSGQWIETIIGLCKD
jgi:hypothetical protein